MCYKAWHWIELKKLPKNVTIFSSCFLSPLQSESWVDCLRARPDAWFKENQSRPFLTNATNLIIKSSYKKLLKVICIAWELTTFCVGWRCGGVRWRHYHTYLAKLTQDRQSSLTKQLKHFISFCFYDWTTTPTVAGITRS